MLAPLGLRYPVGFNKTECYHCQHTARPGHCCVLWTNGFVFFFQKLSPKRENGWSWSWRWSYYNAAIAFHNGSKWIVATMMLLKRIFTVETNLTQCFFCGKIMQWHRLGTLKVNIQKTKCIHSVLKCNIHSFILYVQIETFFSFRPWP